MQQIIQQSIQMSLKRVGHRKDKNSSSFFKLQDLIFMLFPLSLTYLILKTQELIADFEVSEGIYSQARIEETDSVCLWLGANVMLEYSLEEVLVC